MVKSYVLERQLLETDRFRDHIFIACRHTFVNLFLCKNLMITTNSTEKIVYLHIPRHTDLLTKKWKVHAMYVLM